MTYSVIYEKIDDKSFPPGYYYAHVPALDITTHGLGIEGARDAARDLAKLWIEEKRANGDVVPVESDILYSRIEIEDAILGA